MPTQFHNAGTGFGFPDSDAESASGPQAILAVNIRGVELQRGSEGKTLLTRYYMLNSAGLSVTADEGDRVQNGRCGTLRRKSI